MYKRLKKEEKDKYTTIMEILNLFITGRISKQTNKNQQGYKILQYHTFNQLVLTNIWNSKAAEFIFFPSKLWNIDQNRSYSRP